MGKKKTDVASCLLKGVYTSSELQKLTGLSQQGVSRQLCVLGQDVVKMANGRQPQYALTTTAFGDSTELPVILVDLYGNHTVVGYLRPLAVGGYYMELRTGGSSLFCAGSTSGLFDSLPYYLQDLKPDGFMGAHVAQWLAAIRPDYPSDPRQWNDEHLGHYLLAHGDDLPGNVQLGYAGIQRLNDRPAACARNVYPQVVDRALEGGVSGTPLAGRQPKFTVYSTDRKAHVVVKFSPAGDDPVASRWKDVLITEFHAAQTLRSAQIPALDTELFEMDGRLYLESIRMDRHGVNGRSSMISLRSIASEFVQEGSEWPIIMQRLLDRKLISIEHLYDACVLWEFGYLINNTDMHLGNLSMAMDGNVLRILPSHDMCSMGFAPVRGDVKPFAFAMESLSSPSNYLSWSESTAQRVQSLAVSFWERVALDSRISDDFRQFLSRHPLTNEVMNTAGVSSAALAA